MKKGGNKRAEEGGGIGTKEGKERERRGEKREGAEERSRGKHERNGQGDER